LLRYVAKDQSAGRAVYLSAHLTNTMLLLAALTVTAWLAYTNTERIRVSDIPRGIAGALFATVIVSITGAVAALGDTLFPAASLTSGMQQDFSSTSNMLLRLRMVHPAIAVIGAAYLIWIAVIVLKQHERQAAHSAATRVLMVTIFQVAVGMMNITLLAPIWMQLFHLLVADVVWIAVVVMALEMTQMKAGLRLDGKTPQANLGEVERFIG